MGSDAVVTVDDVRQLAADLAGVLDASGALNAADTLRTAAASNGSSPPEQLLELRSALVRTRAEWEAIDDQALLDRARRILAAAKRLAIDL